MTGVPLRIAEPTGRYRRSLRRYCGLNSSKCPAGSYHNAAADIAEVGEAERAAVHGDSWPHDDPRWPATCEACDYAFTPDDGWQRNDNAVYRLPGGEEFTFWGSFGKTAPAGTMIRAEWADEFGGPGESWLVALPGGGEWITTQAASSGGHWTVMGTPPDITVDPSIWHNPPHGWHGWIKGGELQPA